MAKIRLETGQIINFEGNPTPEDIDDVIASLNIKTAPIDTDTSLPEKQKTEALIARRPEAVSEFIEELQAKPKGLIPTALHYPLIGLKGLNILRQRGEAAVANPLMEAQEAVGRSPMETVRAAGRGFLQGLTGERRGELGDVPRRAGFGELPSAFIGLGGLAGLGNIATKGKLMDISPATMSKDFPLRKTEEAIKYAKDLKSLFGEGTKEALRQAGKRKVPVKPLNTELSKIPVFKKGIPSDLAKALKEPQYEIEFLKDGSIKNTIENLDKVKGVLSDFMTKGDWAKGTTDLMKNQYKDAYRVITNAIHKADKTGRIKSADNAYQYFIKIYDDVISKINPQGKVSERGFRSIFAPSAEGRLKEAFDILGKIDPKFKQVTKQIGKFVSRTESKKGAIGLTKELGRIALLSTALRNIPAIRERR